MSLTNLHCCRRGCGPRGRALVPGISNDCEHKNVHVLGGLNIQRILEKRGRR